MVITSKYNNIYINQTSLIYGNKTLTCDIYYFPVLS